MYNASTILLSHPGGIQSILDGTSRDCSRDYDFHGAIGKKMWTDCKIGRLVQCPGRLSRGLHDVVYTGGMCVVC